MLPPPLLEGVRGPAGRLAIDAHAGILRMSLAATGAYDEVLRIRSPAVGYPSLGCRLILSAIRSPCLCSSLWICCNARRTCGCGEPNTALS